MTATKLLDGLTRAGCSPRIEGPDLVFDADPPDELARYLEVLQTGVRALALRKRWFGIDPRTGVACGPFTARAEGMLAMGALDPSGKLPRNVGLLIVEGKGEFWDRLLPNARDDFPDAFRVEIEPRTVPICRYR